MITEEELKVIKEKLYDNEKYPYINSRLIAKKLFEELVLMRANSAPPKEEKPKNYEEPMYISVNMDIYSFDIDKIVLYGLELHPAGKEGMMCLTKIESIEIGKIYEIIVVKAWSERLEPLEPASLVSIELPIEHFDKIILMGLQRYFGNSVYTAKLVGVYHPSNFMYSSYSLNVTFRGELDKTDQEKSTSQILEMAYPELSQKDRENKLHVELAKMKGNESSSRNEFRDHIKDRHIGKEWDEWDSTPPLATNIEEEAADTKGTSGVVGHLGKEGEAGKSMQQYIVELERSILDDSECNLEIQKNQREYIEELKRLIDTNNEYNKRITECNLQLQSYPQMLELRVEQLEKAILEHKKKMTQHWKNLGIDEVQIPDLEMNKKLWSEIYNPENIRSQTVTQEILKENADLKVKLKMALELLSPRQQMLVNLEESSQINLPNNLNLNDNSNLFYGS